MQTREMTAAQAQMFLNRANATLERKSSTTHVYISRSLNKTFTVFASGRPGIVKVQEMEGCACNK